MSEEKTKKGVSRPMFLILVIVLLLSLIGNLFLVNERITTMEQLEANTHTIDTLNQQQFSLEKELERTYADLNEFQGKSEDLDSMLSIANVKLEEFRAKINSLSASNNANAAARRRLKKELEAFRSTYTARIDSLVAVNKELFASNEKLTKDLQVSEGERSVLSEKVALASVLKVGQFDIRAYKVSGSGKRKETTKAKRTGVLKFCFDLLDNAVAEANKKDVLLKITGPRGIVLFRETAGSGLFRTNDTQKDSKYTLKDYIDYDRSKQTVCMEWNQEEPFDPGKYQVEVYVEGFLSGETTIELL